MENNRNVAEVVVQGKNRNVVNVADEKPQKCVGGCG